jgi:4-amino-4-deoxy-L-arabinose transferase-like glycosyltransferase
VTGSPNWKLPPSTAAARSGLILVLIALAAALPRLLLGASQFIEYDGYWHVFIAQQDNWNNFWADIYANAHPPLFFLLLKVALHFGHSLLVYRSLSILTGVASVYLVGRIALKVTASNVRAYQSALAYGLALPGIIVSCEVRSYMLSVFFVLVSFSYLLDIAPQNQAKSRAGFAAGAILACLSHYFAFFYAGAAILVLLAWRSQDKTVKWKAQAATCLPVIATIVTLYEVHAGRLAQIQGHLLPYYFDPKGHESMAAFLVRNWKNFVNLFSPFPVSHDAVAVGILIAALAGALWITAFQRQARQVLTILITAAMLVGFALAALAGKYPFGGDLRQQYLLFPFLVLCGAILMERMAGYLSGLVPRNGRLLVNGLIMAAIVWVSVVRFEQYPKVARNVAADRIAMFDRMEPSPKAVYLDQFNLILFFIYHHTWEWSSLKLPQPIPEVDVYRLRRGAEQMLVFRDHTTWNADPDDSAVYGKMAEGLRAENPGELSVFSSRQVPPRLPLSDPRGMRGTVVKLASGSGICVQRMELNQVGWYATFRQSNCAPVDLKLPQVTGTFDDSNDDIVYTGLWSHDLFREAAGGTVSFSNSPGAGAKLSFEGSEITWVYTKAYNRGIAEVKLDGMALGDVDLYSSKTVWQARKTFGLTPGKHTFEVFVSGRKQAAAAERYVDVDALIVH